MWCGLVEAPAQSVDDRLSQGRRFPDGAFPLDAVKLAAPALYGFQADKPAFEWDARRVADARDLSGSFSALNVQFAAPSFPGVVAGTELFDEWEDRGWLLIDDDSGGAHVFPGNRSEEHTSELQSLMR